MNFEIENDEGIKEKMEGEAAFIPDHGSDVYPNTAIAMDYDKECTCNTSLLLY